MLVHLRRGPQAIWCSWLVDALAGSLREDALLWLRDGTVQAVEEGVGEQVAREAAGARGVPLEAFPGLYLTPGPVDSHVHLGLQGGRPLAEGGGAETAQETLAAGVVGVRDAGDAAGRSLTLRENADGLAVLAAGWALYPPGGYGALLGRPAAGEDLPAAVEELARAGAGHVKVIASGLVDFGHYGRVGPPQFTVEELRRIVALAGRHGLPVTAHASGARAVERALAAGVHSVEHGYFLREESLARMADAGTVWVPTLFPVARATAGDPDVRARTVERHLAMLEKASRRGVIVAAGTDAGAGSVPHGAALPEELELLALALGPKGAVRAATAGAGKVLGLAGYGGWRAGTPVRAVALAESPLQSATAWRRVRAVLLPPARN